MATFNTKKILLGSASLIPAIATRIQEEFQKDGYEVAMDALSSGGYDISITKGGVFKAVLGMKTALKVTLLPQDGNINFEAGIGIWGHYLISLENSKHSTLLLHLRILKMNRSSRTL